MMGMAHGATLMHGEFTPTEDTNTYAIPIGKSVTFIVVQLKQAELQTGKRNVAIIGALFHDGGKDVYSIAGNATGTTYGSNSTWNKFGANIDNAVTGNNGIYTIDASVVVSAGKFFADVTYEWFAI